MKRPIWARLDTESREVLLSPEEMKKRKRRSLIVDATVGAISLPFILLAILKLAGYYLFPVFFLLLIRSIFWSRTAGRELREYRRKHMKALREDQPFSVSAGWVTGKTLLTFSPFYAFWLAIGFFIAIGGFYAWLFLSIPSAFFAIHQKIIDATFGSAVR